MNDIEGQSVRMASRGRMMDFAPRGGSSMRTISEAALSESERDRRERARYEVRRREEIARQIEAQKEADIIARRRAIAARKDLARRLQAESKENAKVLAAREREFEQERERDELARKKALVEQRAIEARRRMIAARRAKEAREELERRRAAESKMRSVPVRDIKNPRGSRDPLPKTVGQEKVDAQRKTLFRRPKINESLGSVEDFETELDNLENEASRKEINERAKADFLKETRDDDFIDDIEKLEQTVADEISEEDTSRNNARYVLGGRSPFINTSVEKRPLSGGTRTMESTASAVSEVPRTRPTNRIKPKAAAKPVSRGRYVPYEEPVPHKNIYARANEKEKSRKDVPTMVVDDSPKGSNVKLGIAIFLTVILGAAVGAIAYLALFQ